MNWIESLRIAWDAIQSNKLRSFLTLLGVIIGVAVVTLVATVIEGANVYVSQSISSLGTGALRIEKASFQGFGNFDKFLKAFNRNPDLKLDDMRALSEQLTDVVAVGAQDGTSAPVRYGNTELTGVGVQGVTPNFELLSKIDVETGRYFLPFDEANRRPVCFLGQDIVKGLFPTGNPVGREIRVGNSLYTVIGVSRSLGAFLGQSQDNFIQVPLSSYLKQFGARRSLILYVKPEPKADPLKIEDQMRVVMRTRHHLALSEEDDFSIVNDEATQAFLNSITGAVAAVALPITSISLVVGGIVIMNIMLVSVTERTREIGIRKSMGARRRDILAQFLAESILLSGFGGMSGVVLAFVLVEGLSFYLGIPVHMPAWAVLTALTVSIAVGLFFGIFPANRAAKLDPIQALRSE